MQSGVGGAVIDLDGNVVGMAFVSLKNLVFLSFPPS
jgi:hypothetical protein